MHFPAWFESLIVMGEFLAFLAVLVLVLLMLIAWRVRGKQEWGPGIEEQLNDDAERLDDVR